MTQIYHTGVIYCFDRNFECSYSFVQSGPLDIEIISEEFLVMLRQLSYAIKNQLKAPKAPY